jgi:CubicO group peptidase (beta-lactamase class C family)
MNQRTRSLCAGWALTTLLPALPVRAQEPASDRPSAAPAAVWTVSDQIDALFAKHVSADTPGAAVLVLRKGEVVHAKGYGLANLENAVPITPQTTFDLASVSKQFTAYAVLILVDQGKLALDDDVRKHVPELPEWDRERPIRVSDLLHQVTGIPDYLGDLAEFPRRDEELTNSAVAELLAKKRLGFATGSKWEYSNSNYLLAALVVERVSAVAFSTFMKREIFDPLRMPHAVVFDSAREVIPRRSYGYTRQSREWEWVHSDLPVTGDGGIWCSLDEFVCWDRELREPTLVDAALLDLAFVSGQTNDGKATDYGFGWQISRSAGEPVVFHSGGWAGFLTYHQRFLDRELAIVVLCNREDGQLMPAELTKKIAAFCEGGPIESKDR